MLDIINKQWQERYKMSDFKTVICLDCLRTAVQVSQTYQSFTIAPSLLLNLERADQLKAVSNYNLESCLNLQREYYKYAILTLSTNNQSKVLHPERKKEKIILEILILSIFGYWRF